MVGGESVPAGLLEEGFYDGKAYHSADWIFDTDDCGRVAWVALIECVQDGCEH